MTQVDLLALIADIQELKSADEQLPRIRKCEQALALALERSDTMSVGYFHIALGLALSGCRLGDRKHNIRRAIMSYEACLDFWQHQDIKRWGDIHAFLGDLYYEVSLYEAVSHNTEAALLHYGKALLVHTREAASERWAQLNNQMGLCHMARGGSVAEIDFDCDEESLREYLRSLRFNASLNGHAAISYFLRALRVLRRGRSAETWAMTQSNCALAHLLRGRERDVDIAVRHLRGALTVLNVNDSCADWAEAQFRLGLAYRYRQGGEAVEATEEAIQHLELALSAFRTCGLNERVASTEEQLAAIYRKHISGDLGGNCEIAIRHYADALGLYRNAGCQASCARIHRKLGESYMRRIYGMPYENRQEAVRHYRAALDSCTPEGNPLEWRMARKGLMEAQSI